VGDDAIDRSPIVTAVGGWAAVDLGLIGVTSGRATLRQRASPIAIGRHLRTAWRVGRLRVALPRLAADIVATVDRDLSAIGRLDAADDDALAELLDRTRRELATVHTFEVLAGMLLHDGRAASNPRSPAGDALPTPIVALHALRLGHAAGLTDADIVAHDPVVLALVPPTLTSDGDPCLPPDGPRPPGPIDDRPLAVDDLDLRDALRLRARWLQELTVRIVRTVAERLAGAERVATPELARELSVAELVGMLRSGAPAPADLAQRGLRQAGPPLPTAFELDVTGGVHTLRRGRGAAASGLPASAGRVAGVVRHRVIAGVAQPDTILVTRHLEPQLAPLLPSLAGLVAETGSALSHLAILAREAHVPAVVGVDDALRRFPPGTRLAIDGATGAIDVLDGPATDTDAMAVAVAS
jgi:pyruvate,water dikinase